MLFLMSDTTQNSVVVHLKVKFLDLFGHINHRIIENVHRNEMGYEDQCLFSAPLISTLTKDQSITLKFISWIAKHFSYFTY